MPALDDGTPGRVGRLALYLPADKAGDWAAIASELQLMIGPAYRLTGNPVQWIRTEQDGTSALHVECDVTR
jgi:hypothetical protein